MLQRQLSILGIGFIFLISCFFKSANAGVVVSVDWDATLAGIQSSIEAPSVGSTVTARISFDLTGSTPVPGYTLSVRFSSDSLALVLPPLVYRVDQSSTSVGGYPISGNQLLDNPAVLVVDPTLGNARQLANFAGFVSGDGPSTGSFNVSDLTFTVLSNVAGPVVLPGFFRGPDVFLDVNGNPVSDVVFRSGSFTAVPEPCSIALVLLGGCTLACRSRCFSRDVDV
jgi:hypothetical protein